HPTRRSSDLTCGQPQFVADHGHEWRHAKPPEKAEKEGNPRQVERSHLDAFKRKNVEFGKRLLLLNHYCFSLKIRQREDGNHLACIDFPFVLRMPADAIAPDCRGDISRTMVRSPGVSVGFRFPEHRKKFIQCGLFRSMVQ